MKLITTLKHIALLPLAIVAVGCATPYQPLAIEGGWGRNWGKGGHRTVEVSENVFLVGFLANGYTSSKQAEDYALLRAAEVTLQHGFRYFKIIGGRDFSTTNYSQYTVPGYTTGYVTSYGYFHATTMPPTTYTIPIFKPGLAFKIQCSNEADRPCYEAATAFAEIRKTYRLKS
jgi:hypothetical protein